MLLTRDINYANPIYFIGNRPYTEMLNFIFQELEKVKNFDWEEWRKRFLKHNNNKKSRVTDLFRKLDEDGDGFLTRFVVNVLI